MYKDEYHVMAILGIHFMSKPKKVTQQDGISIEQLSSTIKQ